MKKLLDEGGNRNNFGGIMWLLFFQSFNLKETMYEKISIDKKPLPKNAELYSLFSHNNHEKSE